MRRLSIGLFALVFLAFPLQAADEPTPVVSAASKRAAEFRAIKKEINQAEQAADQAAEDAKTPEEEAAADALKPTSKANADRFTQRILKLVEANPKDKQALKMLSFALQQLESSDPVVLKLLIEHHATSPKMDELVREAINTNAESWKPLLQAILEKNPDTDIQGLACFALASADMQVGEAKQDKALIASAEKLFLRVTQDFADIDHEDSTLGETAGKFLRELRTLGIGMIVPEVVSKSLDGKPVKLSDYRGKVVVVDIWATWCGPCMAMIPDSRKLVKSLKNKPFTLISVSVDDDKDQLLETVKMMPWTHWWNGPDGGIVTAWNVRFFPTVYVIDAKGVIRYKNIRSKELDEAVEKLVQEAESAK